MRRARGILLVGIAVLLVGCLDLSGVRTTAAEERPTREQAILLDAPYSELVFEIDFLPGAEPSQLALEALERVAREQTLKQTITLLPPEPIPDSLRRAGASWTREEIQVVHQATFDLGREHPDAEWGSGSRAFAHVVFLDANLTRKVDGETQYAMGLSSRNVMWVFHTPEIVDGMGISIPYPDGSPHIGSDELQAGILIHEFGHAMGLVANGIPMVRPHNDPSDPQHSANPESVMAGPWDLVDQQRTRVLRGDSPSDWFDDDDLADLAAFRASRGTEE